jgi:hypothetical protein
VLASVFTITSRILLMLMGYEPTARPEIGTPR